MTKRTRTLLPFDQNGSHNKNNNNYTIFSSSPAFPEPNCKNKNKNLFFLLLKSKLHTHTHTHTHLPFPPTRKQQQQRRPPDVGVWTFQKDRHTHKNTHPTQAPWSSKVSDSDESGGFTTTNWLCLSVWRLQDAAAPVDVEAETKHRVGGITGSRAGYIYIDKFRHLGAGGCVDSGRCVCVYNAGHVMPPSSHRASCCIQLHLFTSGASRLLLPAGLGPAGIADSASTCRLRGAIYMD